MSIPKGCQLVLAFVCFCLLKTRSLTEGSASKTPFKMIETVRMSEQYDDFSRKLFCNRQDLI